MIRAMVFFLTVVSLTSEVTMAQQTLSGFLEKAIPKWKEYEHNYRAWLRNSTETTSVDTLRIRVNGELVRGYRLKQRIRYQDVFRKNVVWRDASKDGPPTTVKFKNESYKAEISPSDDQWSLVSVEKTDKQGGLSTPGSLRVGDSHIVDYLNRDDLVIDNLTETETGIRIEYSFNEDEKIPSGEIRVAGGVLEFSKDHMWLLLHDEKVRKRGRVNESDVSTTILQYEYSTVFDKWPMASRVVRRSYRNGRLHQEFEYVMEHVEKERPLDSEQFYLSHYGLREPDWYRPPPPYWLYVSIGGFVVLVIGGVLFAWGKRKMHKA